MTHQINPRRIRSKKNLDRGAVPRNARGLTMETVGRAFVTILTIATAVRAAEPELARIERHVRTLASPEFGGRQGTVAAKSRDYLVNEFKRLGLEPLFGGSYFQDIPDREPGFLVGRNVGAKLVGSDPRLKDEWVIVAAHFDHLGVRNGVLYPGADDNASAVAMMLEVARCLVESPEKPRRSVMLIGYDLEERGLIGSKFFVEHSPVPLEKMVFFLTADMIGRALAGVCKREVFVMGTEHYPPSREWVRLASKDQPLDVGMIGADLLLFDRSDYGPFRARKVPFLFFSTGENPCYHTPQDIAGTIDYPKAEAISRVIFSVVRSAIQAETRPAWLAVPDNGLDEARSLRNIFETLIANRETLKLGKTASFLMQNALKMLDAMIGRGKITPEERASVIRVAQVVMASIF